jgi:predicted nucleic acid-binding protein
MILLDTNLPTRMTRSQDPQSGVARAAIRTLLGRGERLIVVPQTYGITRILTFNAGDFRSLPITILDPATP